MRLFYITIFFIIFTLLGCSFRDIVGYREIEDIYYSGNYYQSNVHLDSAFWTFTSDGKIYGAIKGRVRGTDPPKFEPINHIRGTYNVASDTITWLIYNRCVLSLKDTNIFPYIAEQLKNFDNIDDSLDYVSYLLSRLYKEDFYPYPDTSLSDASAVIHYRKLVIFIFDPDEYTTHLPPELGEFKIDIWNNDTIHFTPVRGTYGNSFEGVYYEGKKLTEENHHIYYELDSFW